MKSPAGSLTTLMMLAAIVEHSDEMEKAYEQHAGKKLQLSSGVENAGYEFLHRLIANDIVISDNSSKIATAVGLRGQAKPPLAFSVMFIFFPSGLVLYWVVNNLVSIAQQYVITKKYGTATTEIYTSLFVGSVRCV